MGKPTMKRENRDPLQLLGPVKRGADVGEALQEAPGTGGVGNAPLHHLATAQPVPGALPVGRVGHALLPSA